MQQDVQEEIQKKNEIKCLDCITKHSPVIPLVLLGHFRNFKQYFSETMAIYTNGKKHYI